jgi:hypothetical protein
MSINVAIPESRCIKFNGAGITTTTFDCVMPRDRSGTAQVDHACLCVPAARETSWCRFAQFRRNRGKSNGPDGEIVEDEEQLIGFKDEEDRVRRLVS